MDKLSYFKRRVLAILPDLSDRTRAILQALLVTFLWSTSWVLIKIGLNDIPALTFAGLRYTLAFVILLPLLLRQLRAEQRNPLHAHALSRGGVITLLLLGLIYYTLNQGAIFLALESLPAVTLSLLLNFSPVVVALLGIAFLSEQLSARQVSGIVIFLLGAVLYFYPAGLAGGAGWALLPAIAALLATAVAAILGRHINRSGTFHPLAVTVISMGFGSPLLLVLGLLLQGLPAISWQNWLIIGWLALVNTAFAFTLWNHTLRTLTAVESSIINNTMLIQIALLAWIFLGEGLNSREIIGLVVASVGVLLVQLRRRVQRTDALEVSAVARGINPLPGVRPNGADDPAAEPQREETGVRPAR